MTTEEVDYMRKTYFLVILILISSIFGCSSQNSVEDDTIYNIEFNHDNQIKCVLEIDEKLILLSLLQGESKLGNNFSIDIYEIKTGDLLYSLTRDDYLEFGDIYRIDKHSDIPDYDYRVIFENTVVYRNSNKNNHNKELIYKIPNITTSFDSTVRGYQNDVATFENAKLYGYGNFDINDNHIVYSNDDGVWIADRDGANDKLIVSQNGLSKFFPNIPDGLFANPRFIANGTKVVFSVYRILSFQFSSTLSYDIAEQTIEHHLEDELPNSVIYPVSDRYIIRRQAGRNSEIQKLDTMNGDVISYIHDYGYFASYDYETIVKVEDIESPEGVKAFVCNINEPDDTSKQLFKHDGYLSFSMNGITEHYMLFYDDSSIIVVKYK